MLVHLSLYLLRTFLGPHRTLKILACMHIFCGCFGHLLIMYSKLQCYFFCLFQSLFDVENSRGLISMT